MHCILIKVKDGVPPPIGNPFDIHSSKEVWISDAKPSIIFTGICFLKSALPEISLLDGLIFCGSGRIDDEMVIAIMSVGGNRKIQVGEKIGRALFIEVDTAKVRFFLSCEDGGGRMITGDNIKVKDSE